MFKKAHTEVQLDEVIDIIQTELLNTPPGSDQYAPLVDQLSKLHQLRENSSPKKISHDTLAIIGGNLAGIALILSFERLNVVTSKALTFVMKLR